MNKVKVPQLRFPGFEEEWEVNKLNKFASLNPKNSSLPEEFIYIDLESVTDGNLIKENVISKNEAPSRAQRILKENDILYQTVRPYQKNNLYFDKVGDYVASTGYAQIRTKNNSQFLFQFLHTEKFVANVLLRCTGTSYPAINSTDLSNIEMSFPSLPEQQKIASFLSAVDEKIQQLSRKKELVEKYKKGVMQQLFSSTSSEQRSGKLRFKDDNGNDFPDWEEKKLGEVCEIVGGGTPDTNISEYWGGDIQWFTPTEIKSDFVSNSIRTITELGLQKSSAKKLPVGTILLTTRATIGEVSITVKECSTNQGFQSLIVKENNSNIFVFNWIKKNKYELISRANGSTFPEISKSAIEKITVKIPSFPEQEKIANFLSNIDVKIENTNQEIKQMQHFKKGLLQQLFV